LFATLGGTRPGCQARGAEAGFDRPPEAALWKTNAVWFVQPTAQEVPHP
jgi:hypothetical protein